jgi:hypothetical protein
MAVDVELAGVLHHGAGLVGLPLRGGDVHLLQDRLQIINRYNTMSMKGSASVKAVLGIRMFLGLPDPDPLVKGMVSVSGSFPFHVKMLKGLK